VVLRAAGLRVHGRTVTAGGLVPSAGELAVFCRPVVTAPAVVRRDGTVLADAWLPDVVRLGELERHLGDGMIEAIAGAALEKGRLKRRERRRLMSYPLVIRLMIAMALMPDASDVGTTAPAVTVPRREHADQPPAPRASLHPGTALRGLQQQRQAE